MCLHFCYIDTNLSLIDVFESLLLMLTVFIFVHLKLRTMSLCNHCSKVDCVWETIGDEVKHYMQSKLNKGVVGSNVLCKYGYQKSVSLIHGQLLHCVITGIRNEYSDGNEAYKGYRED